MNPQPVSLADELRKLEQKWRSYARQARAEADIQDKGTPVITVLKSKAERADKCADELSALIDQHAAEQPKLTAGEQVREWWEKIHHYLEHQSTPKGLPIDPPILKGCSQEIWDALEVMDYKTFLRAEELLTTLLTSPVAPPPQKVKRPELRHPPVAINCRCDGNKVSALIGPNLMEGVAGFGDNLPEALRDLADELYREVGEPPVAPGEQPPAITCKNCGKAIQRCFEGKSCGFNGWNHAGLSHYCTDDMDGNFAEPFAPPAQERASKELDIPAAWHCAQCRREGEAYVREFVATAAKQAREEALREAAKACESLYEKPIHCEEVGMCVAAIRALAAQPSPQPPQKER